MAPTTINTTGDSLGFARYFTTSVGFLRYIRPFFFFRFGKKLIKHSISSSSRFRRKIGWRPSRERAYMAERALVPLPITRPAGLGRFLERRYEASQGILRVGNWRRKPFISAFRTPKTWVIEFSTGCSNNYDKTTSLSVFCATNLDPLIVGTLTMVLHAPVALLSGDFSRCESIACWSGLARLFILHQTWIGLKNMGNSHRTSKILLKADSN